MPAAGAAANLAVGEHLTAWTSERLCTLQPLTCTIMAQSSETACAPRQLLLPLWTATRCSRPGCPCSQCPPPWCACPLLAVCPCLRMGAVLLVGAQAMGQDLMTRSSLCRAASVQCSPAHLRAHSCHLQPLTLAARVLPDWASLPGLTAEHTGAPGVRSDQPPGRHRAGPEHQRGERAPHSAGCGVGRLPGQL